MPIAIIEDVCIWPFDASVNSPDNAILRHDYVLVDFAGGMRSSAYNPRNFWNIFAYLLVKLFEVCKIVLRGGSQLIVLLALMPDDTVDF